MNRIYGLSVYETPTHFYIIGSDPSGTSFRTLKIDRITETEFIAGEPEHDYSQADIGELLATVSSSSIVTPTEKWNKRRNCVGGSGLLRTMEKAFGIIGAVRFLEGYYLLLVSRAKLVASIGFHSVYKVEDVSMVYIPASGAPSHPDEVKYAKLFQSVDFTADFYFSYTYQLSRTLQENCLAEQQLEWNRNHYRCGMGAEQKFVWNAFLLEPLRKNGVSRKWTLELVRGYVAHQMVELPCARLDLVILARRSAAYAGTRFLKRGTNREGAVANDVETEQIVWDSSGPMAFRAGKFTAFVQRRGSVPLFWSQDSTARGAPMVVGKPPIVIDQVEPHALTTAKHFRELRRKYGHPLIVLNLVKREEHKHNENLLHDIFLKTVRYLNDFRQPGKCIDYISFDVSRCNKSGRVLQRLEELGQRTVLSTGWFQSFSELKGRTPASALVLPLRARKIMPNGTEEAIARYRVEHTSDGRTILQHGCARSNCVDCLDRTNVAQFGIGKAALGWQLFSMGFLDSPWSLHLQTELCRVFEEMFDEHGDTLAWQYAGSQLVHSIKTYKRIAIFQERSRDVLQTISRYYSNTFGDFEKQDGINLFLGIFRVPKAPSAETNSSIATQQQHIWAMGSDHYLHFPIRGPKRGEFLDWAVAVGSDNEQEDEEWLAGDGQFKEWLVLKADEADVTLDNNFVELDAELAVEPAGTEAFDLAHRTFELTSLEQLVRANSQMQLRRPIVLESLDQGPQQSGSFMRSMFKSEHSQSPPPANVAPRKGSAASTLSSLAAGTASIVRETSSSIREAANEASEDEGRGAEAEGLIAEMVVTTLDEKRDSVAFACSPAQEATLAVAATEEECDMEADRHRDLLVVEDRNNPAEWTRRDPLAKFKVLRNDRPMPTKRRPTPPLSLGAGLKSPQDVYFGTSPDSPLLAISSADYGIYSRYASASSVVFERHNARRQKRPTVWRLPAPSVRLRQKLSSSPSPSPRPAFGWRKRDKETPEQPKAVSTSPPPHPFRKDFSKLGPMFQFKPALFTVDSAFHTELGEVPEESMRLYREAVDAIRRERVQRGIPSPDSTCVQFRSRNGT